MDKNRILVVGAGPSQENSISFLLNKGMFVVAIDGDKFAPGLRIANEYEVCNINDSDVIARVAKKYNVGCITSFCTDIPVLPVSIASKKLNLPGLDQDAAELSVNKILQRELAKKHNISIPTFSKFTSVLEAMSELDSFKFPLVIKPSDSSGSKGVKFFNELDQVTESFLEEALALSKRGMGLIEEYIDGPELAVDGFIVNGDVIILSICEKIRTPPPFLLDEELRFPASISNELHSQVEQQVKNILNISGLDNTPFHLELINSIYGPVLVEFAARGAGFNVYDKIIPSVTGVNTLEVQLSLSKGEKPKIEITKSNTALLYFFSSNKRGIIKSITSKDEILSLDGVQDVEIYKSKSDVVDSLKSGLDRIGYVLCVNENLNMCEDTLKEVKNRFKLTLTDEK